MPSTISGFAPGASRTVLTWQTAQLRNVRSTPCTLRLDMPIGRSLPSSNTNPSEAKPSSGTGRCCAQTCGIALKIQYGKPDSRSPPVEPYLKCSLMSS